ncbi:hypothetical protein [Thiocystis violacea]|uniref:hypothetical protein n=1 Tax=Thiocystis violacea TaxID=13725 RepID=UPI001907C7A1|nr:hypothetical protein [Thiocystis violacea]MBK1718624.1 hypothetical protein [Thiocystis violacea]
MSVIERTCQTENGHDRTWAGRDRTANRCQRIWIGHHGQPADAHLQGEDIQARKAIDAYAVMPHKVSNAQPSPASFLLALDEMSRGHRSETRLFIDTYQDLIIHGVKNGYSSMQIFRAFHALRLPPPMSERQFRRYVSQIKRETRSEAAIMTSPVRQHPTRASTPTLCHPPATTQEPPADLDNGAAEPVSERSERVPLFKRKTFDWHPEVDLDDIS